MKKSWNNIIKYVKKDLSIMIALGAIIMICLSVLLYVSGKIDEERAELINVLGRQRMYIQSMAKEANSKYALLQAEKLDYIVESKEAIDDRYNKIQRNIIKSRDEYISTFNQLKSGKMQYKGTVISFEKSNVNISANLKKTEDIWKGFEKSINKVSEAKEIDRDFIDSIIFISDNSETLAAYCDELTEIAVSHNRQSELYYKTIEVLLGLAFLAVISMTLGRLYRHLILPLGTFVEGLSDISILKKGISTDNTTEKETGPIIWEITNMTQKIERLVSLIENINQNLSINEVLRFIFDKFSFFIPYSYIGVALVKEGGKMLEASYGISNGKVEGLPKNLIGKRYLLDKTSLKSIIETGNPRMINDLEEYVKGRPVKEYNRVILEAGIRSSITLPLIANNKPVGIIFFSSVEKNIYNTEHMKFLEVITKSVSISFERNLFMDNLLYSSILALAKLAEARDEDTGEHLERMKVYSKHIAQFLYEDSLYKEQITLEYIDDIERFSPMHDIGKVGIRDGILLKPAKLTEEEFEEMKQHTIFGGKVLRAAEENIMLSGRSIFKVGIDIAEGHHEKWDGSGYPRGKAGEDIPLSARIVAVADVFDALTTERPYKVPYTFEATYDFMIEGSGKHFDPEIIRVFVKNKDKMWKLYKAFHGDESIYDDGVKVV
ncbi:HD domain-containing phosphohydrolase [Clostridium thermarum]|uniref:HD domain-containing phosphohydrolase n=1 Tax=Clostridium thermarum TaxID=1716543 RepID=UPI001121FAFC|nr:HD domain-containing phosphohydrolase [Clostridium thermarum]